MNNEYAAEVARLKSQLRTVESDIAEYRSDYATLVNQETTLAQIIVVCDNTDYLNQCLSSSVTNMEEVASSDRVPGFEELFDFQEVSSFQERLSVSNGNYLTDLKSVCDTIDSKKTEVASNLDLLTQEADRLRSAIQYYGG